MFEFEQVGPFEARLLFICSALGVRRAVAVLVGCLSG